MSDTPRTDGEEYNTSSWDDPNNEMVVHSDFARQLERELNTLHETLSDTRRAYEDRIVDLEDIIFDLRAELLED